MKKFGKLELDDLHQIFWKFFKFQNEGNASTEKCDKHVTSHFYAFFQSFGRAVFLGFKVNNGTMLPCGTKLIADEMTQTDAFLYLSMTPCGTTRFAIKLHNFPSDNILFISIYDFFFAIRFSYLDVLIHI